jgi:hypothetical protein
MKLFEAGIDLYNQIIQSKYPENKRLSISNKSFYSAFLKRGYLEYPKMVVETIKASIKIKADTVVIFSASNFTLFDISCTSFLNCCTDIGNIDKYVAIFTTENYLDRIEITTSLSDKYPFIIPVFHSGDIIDLFKIITSKMEIESHDQLFKNYEYLVYIPEGKMFYTKRSYIDEPIKILKNNKDKIAQILYNFNNLDSAIDYTFDIPLTKYNHYTGLELLKHMKQSTNSKAWWPYFSLEASIINFKAIIPSEIDSVKRWTSEYDIAEWYALNGWTTASMYDTCYIQLCVNIPRKTSLDLPEI